MMVFMFKTNVSKKGMPLTTFKVRVRWETFDQKLET